MHIHVALRCRFSCCEALWFVGEEGDSCDDLCEFEGYAGCDAEETAKLVNRPRIERLLAGLDNSSCSDWGESFRSAAYNPDSGKCFKLKGQARGGKRFCVFSSFFTIGHTQGMAQGFLRCAATAAEQVQCDLTVSTTVRPLCHCNSTTLTSTVAAACLSRRSSVAV